MLARRHAGNRLHAIVEKAIASPAKTMTCQIHLNFFESRQSDWCRCNEHFQALEFQNVPIETADLVVPTTWGDAKDLDKGITNLKNVQDAGHVSISYDLVKDWVVPPPRADHHAILEPEYFEFNTQNGLVHPKFATTTPVRSEDRR